MLQTICCTKYVETGDVRGINMYIHVELFHVSTGSFINNAHFDFANVG